MISIQEWKQRGYFLQLCGHQIFCIDSGAENKPCILLIHGFPTASWDWYKLWPLLENDFRLVALDMLGFGFSDKPRKHQYSIMEQADIVEALARKLALPDCHLLAHDYGDTVAQELLARCQEGNSPLRPLSACLLNGGLFPETHRARFIQKLLLSPLGPLVNLFSGRQRFAKSFCAVFGYDTQPSEVELDNLWQLINTHHGKQVFHKLITYMSDRRQYRQRWLDALRNSPVPVALINGSFDPVSGAHMVARYRELVREDDFIVELPRIGHYPHMEAPQEVAEAFRTFIAQQPVGLRRL